MANELLVVRYKYRNLGENFGWITAGTFRPHNEDVAEELRAKLDSDKVEARVFREEIAKSKRNWV